MINSRFLSSFLSIKLNVLLSSWLPDCQDPFLFCLFLVCTCPTCVLIPEDIECVGKEVSHTFGVGLILTLESYMVQGDLVEENSTLGNGS